MSVRCTGRTDGFSHVHPQPLPARNMLVAKDRLSDLKRPSITSQKAVFCDVIDGLLGYTLA